MNRPLVFFAAALTAVSCTPCFGELILTAEVVPLSGLDGFNSYRITATSDLGNVVGFDFSKASSYGITGPMSQQSPFGQPTVFSNQIFGGADASLDSQFLFNSYDVVSLFSEESAESLHSVFALGGDQQLTIGNSVPFVQIATSSAPDVFLKGSLVVRRPNDEMIEQAVSVRLSDIQVGAAPRLEILPVPPPVAPPVVVLPPPPTINPPTAPTIPSPVMPIIGTPSDPIVVPIVPVAPPQTAPSSPTAIPPSMVSPNNLLLTAEKVPIAGMPGYNSFRITASSDLGNIVCFDFSKVGQYGINGPINQMNPLGQSTVFQNQLFGDADPLQDSQFLVNSDDVVQLFPEESSDSLNAIFAFGGDLQQTIGNSVPFVQIATADEAHVTLKGSFAILRPDGQIVETALDVNLADILVGAAPKLEIIPVPPPPIAEVVVPPTPTPSEPPTIPIEPAAPPMEQTPLPGGTEPQPPQVWEPSIEPPTTFEPPPNLIEPPTDYDVPIVVLPDRSWGEVVIVDRTIDVIGEFPLTRIHLTLDEVLQQYTLLSLRDVDQMMFYDGAVAVDGGADISGGFLHTMSLNDAQFNIVVPMSVSALFGQQIDMDQLTAEVPEPASAAAFLLGLASTACCRPMARRRAAKV